MYRAGLALRVALEYPLFYLLIWAGILVLRGKAAPSFSRQLEARLKGGREKYNREKLRLGEGGSGGDRVLLWQMKTIWSNHTMNKLIPWIQCHALRMQAERVECRVGSFFAIHSDSLKQYRSNCI